MGVVGVSRRGLDCHSRELNQSPRRFAIGGRLAHPLVAENGGHWSGWGVKFRNTFTGSYCVSAKRPSALRVAKKYGLPRLFSWGEMIK